MGDRDFRFSIFDFRFSARRKLVLLLGVLFLGMLLAAPLAWAHAELRKAEPGVGATVRVAPQEVRLWFTQSLDPAGSRIVVLGSRYQVLQAGETQGDSADPTSIAVGLMDLQPGTYTVNWQTQSVDGHALTGSYNFTFQPATPILPLVATTALAAGGALLLARWRRRAPKTQESESVQAARD